MADARTNQCFHVGGVIEGVAGQGGNALDQRLAQQYGIVDRQQGAYVLADHADVGGQAATGHLFTCQYLDQLLLTARGVFGREDHDLHAVARANGLAHRCDGLWLVVLNADQHLLWVQNMLKYLDTRNDLLGVVTHGTVVGRDVRLTLGAINDQRMNFLLGARLEFDRGREARTAQAADACLTDNFQQGRGLQALVITHWAEFTPLILAIHVKSNSPFLKA